jgi:hypothetical protein
MTDFDPRLIAGHYGYTQVTPTSAERARGYDKAFMVLDFSRTDDDGHPEFVGDAVCTRSAAIRNAEELARYHRDGGESLNRQAVREWAAQLTA